MAKKNDKMQTFTLFGAKRLEVLSDEGELDLYITAPRDIESCLLHAAFHMNGFGNRELHAFRHLMLKDRAKLEAILDRAAQERAAADVLKD